LTNAVFTVFVKDSMGYPKDPVTSYPSIEVEVSDDESLHNIARKAVSVLRLQPLESVSMIFVSKPDALGDREFVPYLYEFVGEDGMLTWRIGSGSIQTTAADLRRTSDAGLFEGDPVAFFVDRGSYGDGGLIASWDDLLGALKQIGAVGGGVAVVATTARWLWTFLMKNLNQWLRRNAKNPAPFFHTILRRKTWSVSQFAQLLGIRKKDASRLLKALGYERLDGDNFRWSSDPKKAALRKQLEQQEFLFDWQAHESNSD
jgi:hypothetical protein